MTKLTRRYLLKASLLGLGIMATPNLQPPPKKQKPFDHIEGVLERGQSIAHPPNCRLEFELVTLPTEVLSLDFRAQNDAGKCQLVISDGYYYLYDWVAGASHLFMTGLISTGVIEIIASDQQVSLHPKGELASVGTASTANILNTQGVYYLSGGAIVRNLKVWAL